MRFSSKSALVTGAGSGIGQAIAERLVEEGARVIVADVVPERVNEVAEQLGSAAVGVVADVSKQSEVVSMIDKALTEFGRLDVLCNNAGIFDGMTPLAEVSDALWERMMCVNVDGIFYACRRALPLMLEQGGGAIVNTASLAGICGGKGGSAYTVSKHAVVGLTRSVAFHYGPQGVRCNAVCPGGVFTRVMESSPDIHAQGMERMLQSAKGSPEPAEPGQIADTVAFLASDDARYVNGAILPVDGGWSAV